MTMNYNLVSGIRLTTPLAKFQYPKLVEPETKFNPEGVYKLTAVLDAADANDISEALDTLLNNHKASLKAQDPTKKDWKLADLPYSFEDFDGKPSFIVKVKMKAKGVGRDGKPWTAAPAIFDAKGQPVRDRESLKGMWSGTTGRVSFEAQPFFQAAIGAGITLRLKAVQVIDLVEGGGSAESYGFGEESGWSGSSEATPFDSSTAIPLDESDF
jgi:hypothetical protein